MPESELSSFFEKRHIGDAPVPMAVTPMTEMQARGAYPYRHYTKHAESRFGGDAIFDDALLAQGKAERCGMCQAPTRPQHLEDGVCFDCNGRSELTGVIPHKPEYRSPSEFAGPRDPSAECLRA